MEDSTESLLFANETQGPFKDRKVINLSGHGEGTTKAFEIRQLLEPIPAYHTVVLPDVSATEKNVVPTGTITRFGPEVERPLQYAGEADIGCGMVVAQLPGLGFDDFSAKGQLWLDQIYDELKRQKKEMSLGSGNHFLDFAIDEGGSGALYVVIHTGSLGDMQKQLGKFIAPDTYDEKGYFKAYEDVLKSARENRTKILDLVAKVCGKAAVIVSNTIHNTVQRIGPDIVIHKGVVQVTNSSDLQVLPSSMNGKMALYTPGMTALKVGGVLHGTGSAMARSAVDKEAVTAHYGVLGPGSVSVAQMGILVPTGTGAPVTETPDRYNTFEETLEKAIALGLVGHVESTLSTLGYIGHV